VPRDEVHNILLPQKFDRETLLNAHGKAESIGKKFNEDSVLCVEMLGINFKALPGEPRNIKVTTNADFAVAEQIIREFYG
jgi:2-C-methyl-D-erythritol 4-phosphate cytidylyltransferase